MAKNAINIGRGPKSAIEAAITSKKLGPLDFVVTKEEDGTGGELVLVDEDSSQVLVTPRTQNDIQVTGEIGAGLKQAKTLPAGATLDDFAAALLENPVGTKVTLTPNTDSDYKIYGDGLDRSYIKTVYIKSSGSTDLGDVDFQIDSNVDEIANGTVCLDHNANIRNFNSDTKEWDQHGITPGNTYVPNRLGLHVIYAIFSSIDGVKNLKSNKLYIELKFPEVFDDYTAVESLAASHPDMYAGQTVKVKNADGTISVYTLEESSEEGKNFKLVAMATASGADGVKTITASEKGSNRVVVQRTEDSETKSSVIAIPGAVYDPDFNNETGALTFKKATDAAHEEGTDDETVTIDLSSLKDDHNAVTRVAYPTKTEGENAITDTKGLEIITHTAGQTTDVKQLIPIGTVEGVTLSDTAEIPTLVTRKNKITEDGTGFEESFENIALAGIAFGPTFDQDTGTFTVDFTNNAGEKQTIELKIKEITKTVIPTGGVSNPSYDAETRTITLPVQKEDGTAENLIIALGKDLVVSSGRYDTTTQEIVLVLNNDSEVKIPAAALVDVYTGKETTTAKVTVSQTNEISVNVKVATREGGNLLKVDATEGEGAGGLYVDPADFATDEKTIESITQIVTEKVVGEMMGPVDPDPENPDAPTEQPIKVKDYVDNSINDATGMSGITNEDGSQMSVKDYVDSQTLQITSKFVNFGVNEPEVTG